MSYNYSHAHEIEYFSDDCGTIALNNRTRHRVIQPYRYLKFFTGLDDKQHVNTFIALQRWLNDSPPIPGNLYLRIINDCYKKNLLVSNTMLINGELIDLSNINVPLLTIVAEDDDLVSKESTLAAASNVASRNKSSISISGDHISLCISTMAHKKLWPEVAKWVLSR